VTSDKRPKPVVLVILDGWGHREETSHNAIATAKTPTWNAITRDYPQGLINASELHVGLPEGQMGNSEVGHMNIGSGRVLMQELPKIDQAIASGALAKNPRLVDAIKKIKSGSGVCHLMGLLSDGGVHSHQKHVLALAKTLAGEGIRVKVHAFLDGRDTPPQSALDYMKWFEEEIKALPDVKVATVSGRYYAMDRDKRWDRVHKAYDTLASGAGERYASALEAIEKSYAVNVTDEFALPAVIGDYKGINDGDGVIMANFRADRVREILTALLDSTFKEFSAVPIKFSDALGMTEYSKPLSKLMGILFPPEPLTKILGEVVAEAGMKQLRIAETEKYAHVTFFFNGGREQEFPGEERILVPSPKVATYDLKPEMSAFEVTDRLVEAIGSGKFDFIVVNYANTDMVGHTGDIKAAAKAVEAVDTCLGKVITATLKQGGALFITADHGNAEMMFDHDTDQAHTAHTLNLVPAIIISEKLKGKNLSLPEGKLADVAPTILQLLGLPQPKEMTGQPLLSGYV
jgi:2,3-bisphosphoglycerate-independent phosphoglycerate mutase